MLAALLGVLGAITGAGALVNSIMARRGDKANSKTLAALDAGKLDVDVAELGHNILVDSMKELRVQVADCHLERDELRSILEANGLIPKLGTRKEST